ncbi:MAG: FAD-binding protein [Candidatus Falkowbacteria bacterium]|nr:FAD-binding protein [Candidatus Falkowbacteria bacterium]
MDKHLEHKNKTKRISSLIKKYSLATKQGQLNFYHKSTNSTRPNNKQDQLIDISDLNEIIEINVKEKYVLVEPNVSMEKLVAATVKYNLIPPVVMEFPKITCGGAVNGASLESSSFKYGQLSDTCEEYEIILGNGKIIRASKKINSDLFYGISGSYGTLGFISLLKIKLLKAKKYVKLNYYPTGSFKETIELIKTKATENKNDYIDAIIYDKSHGVVMTGKNTDSENLPIKSYSKISEPWFHRRVKLITRRKQPQEELIPLADYCFRYDRGAYWMGEFAFPLLGVPDNKLTRFIFNDYAKTHKLFEALQTLNVSQNYFVQDIYLPFNKTLNSLKYNEQNEKIYPVWLCPIKATDKEQKLSPHYIKDKLLIDIGIYGQTNKYLLDPIKSNRKLEAFAKRNGGRKMLYAHAYYTENEFWSIYNKDWYNKLRIKYHAQNVFPDVWKKTHVSGHIKGTRWCGFFKYFFINPIKRLIQ